MIDFLVASLFSLIPQSTGLFLLQKNELAVYLVLRKQAIIYPELQKLFEEMSKSEYNHAMIISLLLGNKLQLTANALFSKEQSITWTKIGWDSGKKDYQVAGLVYDKFFFTKIFFWFQHPNLYSLIDKLAFMYVLEKFQVNFYKVLSKTEAYEKLNLIVNDEDKHTENLLIELKKLTPNYKQIINQWEFRKILSILTMVLELVIISIKLSINLLIFVFS